MSWDYMTADLWGEKSVGDELMVPVPPSSPCGFEHASAQGPRAVLRPFGGARSLPAAARKPSSLSWASSLVDSSFCNAATCLVWSTRPILPLTLEPPVGLVTAAWTRRSRGEPARKANRKSWKQRTDMYMRPFLLNVFFSRRFIHAKVMHRGTCKVISCVSTNASDLRNKLPSLTDADACITLGRLIAERSMEADVFALAFEPRKDERIEGKLGIVIETIKENGIIFVE